jgi:NitT/TauT family transport system substrate-binding protein
MRATYRLRVAQWIGALALAFFLVPVPHESRAEDTIRIAVGVDPVFTPWWIAEQKGFFRKRGLKADLTQFSGGPDAADATMAGQADISSSGTATWMPRLVRGGLLVLGTMATSPDALKMAARTTIKTLSDLQGKKVGTVGGSTTDYLWVLTAKKLDVPESAFDLISMPPPELIPSIDRGDIQAYFVWEPWATRGIEVSGKDKVHILANSGDVGYLLNFIVVANKKFAEANPDATVRVLAALREAIDFQNANPAEAARIGAETNKLNPQMASYIISLYNFALGIAPEMEKAARTEEAWMRSKQRLKGDPVDWSKIIDRSYLDRALANK